MDKRNSETYYDIEIEFEEALIKNGFVEDIFYLRDLKQRKLFISTNICQETVDDAIRHIMQINREDKGIARNDRNPIILYVTSNGGDVDAGFALVDVILSSETPVYVINQGYQYSMGFLIGLAGHKRNGLARDGSLTVACNQYVDKIYVAGVHCTQRFYGSFGFTGRAEHQSARI